MRIFPGPAARSRRTVSGTTLIGAFVPGALAGTQIAGLLFFLNPHLPFDLLSVLRGFGFFGLLLGGAGMIVLLPLARDRSGRFRNFLPWSLTIVLGSAALSLWIHTSHYAFFLPSGINRRLLKAAIWQSLGALICFYTALVHRVRSRPYGRRSRVALTLIALASIYVVLERREAFKPYLGPTPRATTFVGSPRPQLVVVGIDAATLDAILPLAEQGRLPFFNKMLREGAHARLSSLRPTQRIPLWTTLASGKYPFRHGIVSERVYAATFLGNREVLNLLPIGVGFQYWGCWNTGRPIDSGSRRVLVLWEILSRLETTTGLVGWPLTVSPPGQAPPEGVRIEVSEEFFEEGNGSGQVWPAEVAERARLFNTRLDRIDPSRTAAFGPKPPAVVLRALAGDLWREELSFFLLEQDPEIEAFFVVLPGLREISERYFGGYSAVRFEGSQHPASEEAAQLVSAYYMHLDEYLARLWERSREPRLLAVISPHGAQPPHGWREAWRVLRLRPAVKGYFDRGPNGVLLLLGEGIRAEAMVRPAELVDLVPTLLYGLGFPIARDFDGAVLTAAFDTSFLARRPLTFMPSYETFAAP